MLTMAWCMSTVQAMKFQGAVQSFARASSPIPLAPILRPSPASYARNAPGYQKNADTLQLPRLYRVWQTPLDSHPLRGLAALRPALSQRTTRSLLDNLHRESGLISGLLASCSLPVDNRL